MHEATSEPLSPQDREEILVDMEDLEVFQTLLEPRGIRGLLVDCGECEEQHFFEWELLRSNLRHLLDAGRARARAGLRPEPTDYVAWDYARGFADGVLSESERRRRTRDGPPTIDLR